MTATVLQVDNLSKSFGGLHAVKDVTLGVAQGERRVLIGPNGAGKTTLFNCIAGTLKATSGRISLAGADITAMKEHHRIRLGMSRTFQISNVFGELTVAENLALAILGNQRAKWTIYRPVSAYRELNDQVMNGLEEIGLAARAHEEARLLSYGERRQLELAFALNASPKILLLDEPCAGLSPSERQDLAELIAALPRSITLLMIEHDIDIALALADRVSVLHRGEVLIEGTPDEVKAHEEVREVYFGRV